MDVAIQDYFDDESKNYPYTMTGLALSLGMSRRTLSNYSHDDEFLPSIKQAKQFVENMTAQRMIEGKGWGPGHIFVLKNNYRWKDTQHLEAKVDINEYSDAAREVLDRLPDDNSGSIPS